MRGLTHIIFGLGFISASLTFLQTPIEIWGVGTFIIAPIFSRLPDFDQKIARITFNQIVPHRGKLSHNLLYVIPVIICFYIPNFPFLQMIIISSFGALFIHVIVDSFNSGGVWFGFIHLSVANISWNSYWGNLFFKLTGITLLGLSIYTYL